MTSEQKDMETKLIYDDRKKELTQVKSQVTENKTDEKEVDGKKDPAKLISTVNQSMNVVYTEEGIRLAHKNLTEEIKFLEKREIQLSEQLDNAEMTFELKELKDKLDKISKYTQSEKAKAEHETIIERLKELNKDLSQLKDTIGTRLKL